MKIYTMWFMTLILTVFFMTGCGSKDNTDSAGGPYVIPDRTLPMVTATMPADLATGVAPNTGIAAVFSVEMDAATIITPASTFTLVNNTTSAAVTGTVSYIDTIAVFRPSAALAVSTPYTATITTGVKGLDGKALAVSKIWSFTTGTTNDTTAPTVSSTFPADGETGVALNGSISAIFSEWMDPTTITTTTFTLMNDTTTTSVAGAVRCSGLRATFNPTSDLAATNNYTATITTFVKDLAGNTMAVDKVWSFVTGTLTTSNPLPVALDHAGYSAGNFVILAKSAVGTTGVTAIVGDVGISPAAASYITGFGLVLDSTQDFSRSDPVNLVTGKIYAADYTGNGAGGTPGGTSANMTAAISNMEWAYTDAAGRTTPDFTELGAGDISGLTLPRGLYKWGTGVLISTDIYLDGSATDVWIFQIAQGLTVASGARIHLTGGALAKNIFWQTFGAVTLETTSHMEGVILTLTNIEMKTGATANSRLLAQTAVTLDANTVTKPTP